MNTRGASRWRAPEEPCLNCGDPTTGAYCPSCGQRKTDVRVSVHRMLADALEDQLVLNRALPRTIVALLFHPGFLTDEYVRGRIVRYIAPLRLYLVSSVLMFLVISFVGLQALERVEIGQHVSTDADSARSALQETQRALIATDTTGMSAGERQVLQQRLVSVRSALAAIPDTAAVLDSTTLELVRNRVDGDVLAPGMQQPWARTMSLDAGTGWLERALRDKVAQLGHLPPREAVQALVRDLLVYAPHMIFLLLPVFALLLKLLYIRRGRYYAEHFVFALHVHAFVFVVATIMFVQPWGRLDMLLFLGILAYVWLALRRVYRQDWLRTTVKWWTLGFLYGFVLLFGLAGLALATLLLT